jgi:hypothetical protein
MLRRVALVRTDVSEELSASFIRVTRIGWLGSTLAATSNLRTLRRNPSSPILVTLMKEALSSQKTPFFIVTAVKTSNLTVVYLFESQPVHFCSRSMNEFQLSALQWPIRPPLWSNGQSSWLLTQSSPVRFPALPDFLSSSGSGTGSTQPL